MKSLLVAATLAASTLAAGCSTSGWISAAGEAMQARDAYDRQARDERLKRANAAAARVHDN
ncbi:hypothetical protein BW38_00147 [Stenotrophomonas sp. RIT309]|uniref:hypothetical protein n=1 Tax=Stenotrophomonas TaxID=40323 RepID=UPI00044B7C9F|nr:MULTISPECIES: hypothetical protein [Stenotrophomonas]EZP47766.1 hypothetical protein BW38_00147 [Stenotrophomonas sp. RIT309]PJL12963.1 hypothetical protein B9Y68_09330 [Stenotrophomonas maltophilia]PJL21989.1 hypothetical protein B9Y72_09330 [Stenotrophomonas maltophilia]